MINKKYPNKDSVIHFASAYRNDFRDGIGDTSRLPLAGRYATFDDTDDYISAPHLAGTETVVSVEGTVDIANITISAGRIDVADTGKIWDLVLSDSTHYTFCEGLGTDLWDISGSDNHATLSNISTVTFWHIDGDLGEGNNYPNTLGYGEVVSPFDNQIIPVSPSFNPNPLDYTGNLYEGQVNYPIEVRDHCLSGGSAGDQYVQIITGIPDDTYAKNLFWRLNLNTLSGTKRIGSKDDHIGIASGVTRVTDGSQKNLYLGYDDINAIGIQAGEWFDLYLRFDTDLQEPVFTLNDTEIRVSTVGLYDENDFGNTIFIAGNGIGMDYSVCDFRWFNSSLTESELIAVRKGESSGKEMIWLGLTEGAGSVLYDISGNSRHGTVVNLEVDAWDVYQSFFSLNFKGYSVDAFSGAKIPANPMNPHKDIIGKGLQNSLSTKGSKYAYSSSAISFTNEKTVIFKIKVSSDGVQNLEGIIGRDSGLGRTSDWSVWQFQGSGEITLRIYVGDGTNQPYASIVLTSEDHSKFHDVAFTVDYVNQELITYLNGSVTQTQSIGGTLAEYEALTESIITLGSLTDSGNNQSECSLDELLIFDEIQDLATINNYSSGQLDPLDNVNCMHVYKFDGSDITADSKGSNNLILSDPLVDHFDRNPEFGTAIEKFSLNGRYLHEDILININPYDAPEIYNITGFNNGFKTFIELGGVFNHNVLSGNKVSNLELNYHPKVEALIKKLNAEGATVSDKILLSLSRFVTREEIGERLSKYVSLPLYLGNDATYRIDFAKESLLDVAELVTDNKLSLGGVDRFIEDGSGVDNAVKTSESFSELMEGTDHSYAYGIYQYGITPAQYQGGNYYLTLSSGAGGIYGIRRFSNAIRVYFDTSVVLQDPSNVTGVENLSIVAGSISEDRRVYIRNGNLLASSDTVTSGTPAQDASNSVPYYHLITVDQPTLLTFMSKNMTEQELIDADISIRQYLTESGLYNQNIP